MPREETESPERIVSTPRQPEDGDVGRQSPPIAILVNGASSSGKTTFCRALQERLTHLSDGNPETAFARVAFDDIVLLMSDRFYPISFVKLQGGDLSRLVSRTPHDGRAGWEYTDESGAAGKHGGSPRLRLVLNPHGDRLLSGVHRSWAAHLGLGTNLIIDHFLQDAAWAGDVLDVLRRAGATVFCVGVFCSLEELERRESSRGDGGVEGRPLGLARRSDELCHSHAIDYHATVATDRQTTAESVEIVVAALQHAGLLNAGPEAGLSHIA
jgi:chloramphenicol 3-O phosphotransferase